MNFSVQKVGSSDENWDYQLPNQTGYVETAILIVISMFDDDTARSADL
jgi:hypothetical protein